MTRILLTLIILLTASEAFAQQGGVFKYVDLVPTTLPTVCTPGMLRIPIGSDVINSCSAPNTWSTLGGGSAATTILTAPDNTNLTYYPLIVGSSSGGQQATKLTSGFSINPSTDVLTATTFSGALSGNATSATNVGITNTNVNASFYPTFVTNSTSTNQNQKVTSGFSVNPSNDVVTATNFNATSGYQINGANFATVTGSNTSVYVGLGQPTAPTATANVAIGDLAGGSTTTGGSNVWIGYSAGGQNQTDSNSLGIGNGALANQRGSSGNNVAFGSNALVQDTTGAYNVANGSSTGASIQGGSYNVALGGVALNNDVSGNGNVAVGLDALFNTTSSNNIGIGYQAGLTCASGATNILIGSSADCAASTTTNTIAIGNVTGASNTVSIGNSSILSNKFFGYLTANSIFPSYATTATAGATTTLTSASAGQQFFTGTTTQTLILPVVSTLVLGQQFFIVNNSTGAVTVQSSGLNNIQVMAANTFATFTVILISGTTASSWAVEYTAPSGTPSFSGLTQWGAMYANATTSIASTGIGTSGDVLVAQGSAAPVWNNVGKVAYIREEEVSGTHSGTFTAAAWQTRVLNTISDPDSIVNSLSANQFSLPAGTYRIDASAPAYNVAGHKAKLYNITDATDTLIGTSGYSANASIDNRSFVTGTITITAAKTFELRHYCNTTAATDGLGVLSSAPSTVEVYAQVTIEKLK